jgi:hypothetical protein
VPSQTPLRRTPLRQAPLHQAPLRQATDEAKYARLFGQGRLGREWAQNWYQNIMDRGGASDPAENAFITIWGKDSTKQRIRRNKYATLGPAERKPKKSRSKRRRTNRARNQQPQQEQRAAPVPTSPDLLDYNHEPSDMAS